MFETAEPENRVTLPRKLETVKDIDIKITESPLERSGEFKAIDFNGLTLCYDSESLEVIHNSEGISYVSVMGNLIVLYDKREDLNGVWFAAERIQKIDLNDVKRKSQKFS